MEASSDSSLSLPPHGRDSSPELGSSSRVTTYNKYTGRPIRKSAGKIKKPEGFVDLPASDESEGDEDDDDDDDEARGRATKQKNERLKKRKRGPSPPSPSLNPIIYEEELEDMTDLEELGAFRRETRRPSQQTMLQFNVPLGFHGPLFVKLESNFMENNKDALHEMKPGKPKKARTALVEPASTVQYRGFTDLPPELRNTIYRHLFARKDQDDILKIPVIRYGPSGALSRSAQFLRTCKLVYSEGCSVLYGENTFSFHRHYATRCTFWEAVPKEIGYQDVLHFLKMIGPENLQYLRDIKWSFDDAYPRDTPYLSCNEERRYLNDEYLISCLRILRNAKLRKITLFFGGRRQLQCTDFRFLHYLEQIKADEVVQSTDRFYSYRDKAHPLAWSEIKAAMTRKKKLYDRE
ncbi:hypothetical protein yc1106_02468 [Curvularia clavata]|uniref:Uncharacterized protein n=1 Tax=Curvularia clavata TaxID=95742 RepID=A0A9Q8Z3A3_CURCL|nr:hypothetical protein yc1106_02468 [Curvularia clavata]